MQRPLRWPRVTGIEPPGAFAVRAAILAANGYEDGARNDARLPSAKPLLPEEREESLEFPVASAVLSKECVRCRLAQSQCAEDSARYSASTLKRVDL